MTTVNTPALDQPSHRRQRREAPPTAARPAQPEDSRALLTIPDFAHRCSISVSGVWRLIRARELRTVRVGARATRIEAAELRRYLDSLSAAPGEPAAAEVGTHG